MTHTVARLEVSAAVYGEVAALLKAAGYGHCFIDDGVIDMSGIGLATRELKGRRCAYFGCKRMTAEGRAGHHFLGDISFVPADLQHGSLDGPYAPDRKDQPQSVARLTHVSGITIVSMWDRTGDERGNSNSSFLADAILSFDEVITLARQQFPEIVGRIEKAAPITLGRR